MTEVRAASGIPSGVPGSWYSRKITANGEIRGSSIPVNRNWSHRLGGGPIRAGARYWSNPIGESTDYPRQLTPLGIDVAVAPAPPNDQLRRSRDLAEPGRLVSNAIESVTGSHTAGEMAAGYLSVAVPFFKRQNPYLFLFPASLALASGGVQFFRKKSATNIVVSAGAAYLAGPIVFYGLFLGAAISGLLGPVT